MSSNGDHRRSFSGQGRRRAPNDGSSHPFDAFHSQTFGSHPFGMMMGGGIGGSSIFDDFFRRDPFDDPFFQRPMGMLGAFGGGSLFGHGPSSMGINSFFDRSGFFSGPSHGSFLEQHPVNLPIQTQPERRRGPVIEELTDDVEGAGKAEDQPIVEHPDDEGVIAQRRDENQVLEHENFQSRYHPQPAERGYASNNSFQSFSFHSSSVSHSGAGGSYVRSSVRRQGPDGLIHEEHFEKDSSGNETRSSARGLRDKLHAMTKKRNAANEPETTVETLRNLTPEEAPDFDSQWVARANRSLPGWNNHHAQMLESSGQRGNRRVPQALPQNSSDGHQARRFRS